MVTIVRTGVLPGCGLCFQSSTSLSSSHYKVVGQADRHCFKKKKGALLSEDWFPGHYKHASTAGRKSEASGNEERMADTG